MIETAEDYNQRLDYCGCCVIQLCPAPLMVCEAKFGDTYREDTWDGITYDASGDVYAGDPIEEQAFQPAWTDDGSLEEVPTIYRKLTKTYSESIKDHNVGDPVLPNTVECTSATVRVSTTYTYGGGKELTTVWTYTLSEPLTKEDLAALALAEAEADDWTPTTLLGAYQCNAVYGIIWATYPVTWTACPYSIPHYSEFGASCSSRKIRFRFRVPDTHLGSYFKITYDIGEFPGVGDPSFFSEDNVVEWTGPGTGDESDPSWLTPWVEIDPPDEPGQRRVVNIRYTCRHGAKFPALPQVMGEALEIPPP